MKLPLLLGRNAAMKLMLRLPAAVEVDTIPGRRSPLLGGRDNTPLGTGKASTRHTLAATSGPTWLQAQKEAQRLGLPSVQPLSISDAKSQSLSSRSKVQ